MLAHRFWIDTVAVISNAPEVNTLRETVD